jgi:hypothetical protein
MSGSHRRSVAGTARSFIRRYPSAEERDDTDEAWVEDPSQPPAASAESLQTTEPHKSERGFPSTEARR